MASAVSLHDLSSTHLPAPVPYAVLAPGDEGPLPICILLMGGGGTRESLIDLQPVFDGWWSDGILPPMRIVTPTAGLDYYLGWDEFFVGDLIPAIRAAFPTSGVTHLAGISGGGYGALKLAFARPELFASVAAMQPMLEPGLRESDVGARNRLHHAAGGPPKLIGPERDAALWEANNPANRAVANAQAIRDSGIAIYLEAADRDFLNAHDGAEFLHRTLWDLDVAHEYHLVREADHGGPTMRPRLRAMFAWLGAVGRPAKADEAIEQAAAAWAESGMQGKPPAGATTTNAFIQSLRARFEPLRNAAAASDPTTTRRYGKL
jgi:S-formylglutathione hydrolase